MGEHNGITNGTTNDGPRPDGGNNGESRGQNNQLKPVEVKKKTAEEIEKEQENDKFLTKAIDDVLVKRTSAGAPTILTARVVRQLIAAFQAGMNDTIACHYARISRESFYRHMKENKAFSDIIQDARDSIIIQSGQTVVRVIKHGDDRVAGPLAFKMLERLARDKYGVDNNVVINNNTIAYKPPSWFTNPDKEVIEGEEVVIDKKA